MPTLAQRRRALAQRRKLLPPEVPDMVYMKGYGYVPIWWLQQWCADAQIDGPERKDPAAQAIIYEGYDWAAETRFKKAPPR